MPSLDPSPKGETQHNRGTAALTEALPAEAVQHRIEGLLVLRGPVPQSRQDRCRAGGDAGSRRPGISTPCQGLAAPRPLLGPPLRRGGNLSLSSCQNWDLSTFHPQGVDSGSASETDVAA